VGQSSGDEQDEQHDEGDGQPPVATRPAPDLVPCLRVAHPTSERIDGLLRHVYQDAAERAGRSRREPNSPARHRPPLRSPGMWFGVVVFVVSSLIVAEIGRRSLAGTHPRNHIAGIRLPSTLADDESWAIAHRAGGRALVVTGLLGAVLGLAAGVIEVAADADASAAFLGAASVVLLVGVLVSARQGLRALRERDAAS
jgi:hypothetical protein